MLKKVTRSNWTVLFILLALPIQLIPAALRTSVTSDERVHFAAGFSYVRKADFRMNPEHPPFIKELCALPVIFTSAVVELPVRII